MQILVLASVKENKNIDSLIKKIKEKLSKKFTSNNTALITRERHRVKLNDCLKEIDNFLKKDQNKDIRTSCRRSKNGYTASRSHCRKS